MTIIDGTGARAWTTGMIVSVGAADVSLRGPDDPELRQGHRAAGRRGLPGPAGRDRSGTARTGFAVCDASMLDIDLGNAVITQNQTGILLGGSSSAIRNGSREPKHR